MILLSCFVHAYLYLCVVFCAVLVSFLICIVFWIFWWLADLNWTRSSTEIMEWFYCWFSTFQVFILSDLKLLEVSTLKWMKVYTCMVALTSPTVFILNKFTIFVCCLLFFYFEWLETLSRSLATDYIYSFRITNLPWKVV